MNEGTRNELLTRQFHSGVTVTNCVKHIAMPILNRPSDCRLCHADVANTLSRAIKMNEWLNQWKDDATKVLAAETV